MTLTIDTSHSSPNYSSRFGVSIMMLVLHATAGSYASSLAWLCNPASKVSSHYLIRKDGHVAQMVADVHAAWHAGKSAWLGMGSDRIALCSLGIELENANDGRDPYPPAQLRAAHDLCVAKIQQYQIPRAYVVRHLDIAVPTGRKTDPAPPAFPWPGFADSLYMDPSPPPPAPIPRFRVKATVTGGATIRSAPRRNASVLGRLHAGDSWEGESVKGGWAEVKGFGQGDTWIVAPDGRAVWANLLDKMKT